MYEEESSQARNGHVNIKNDMMRYTVKKGYRLSSPKPGCHLRNSPWAGIIKLFPARESLDSDIPAGDGKMANLFLQCRDGHDKSFIYAVKLFSGCRKGLD
jgi:hypothetical protein